MSVRPSPVSIARHGATAVLTLQCPENRNALTPAMRDALTEAVYAVRRDAEIRALVLTGVDGVFCAGGDLKGLVRMQQEERDIFEGRSRILEMHGWFDALLDFERPVIAAVDGPAFGAGLSLALAADFVLATPRASFCAVFACIGYVPDLAAMYLLPRRIGLTHAKDMVFSARVVAADEAYTMGLVHDRIEGDLQAAALNFAARFHDAPSDAIGLAKSIMGKAYESDRQTIVAQEAMAQAICRESAYHRAAISRLGNAPASPR